MCATPSAPSPTRPVPASGIALALPAPAATDALGRWLASELPAVATLLLSGPIGAGKSHLARALIRARLGAPDEDVPSPSFTLVQIYDGPDAPIWHVDLYRLGGPDETQELGLEAAFDNALCLIEWPERLGDAVPDAAIRIDLALSGDGRQARITGLEPATATALAAWSARGITNR